MKNSLLLSLILLPFSFHTLHADPKDMKTTPQADDPDMLWAEEVLGEQALDWMRAENDRSLDILEAEPVYSELKSAAEALVTSKDRIPYGSVRDGYVYNFWQDETNVRGLWRRVPLDEYGEKSPRWETILDFDKLAEEEDKNWVFKGASVHRPQGEDRYYALLSLSDGGKDAVVKREFDIETKSFLPEGFTTPEAKQSHDWVDADTLLIATDWGGDTLTESGYPMVVKRWQRGTPLADAKEMIRGQKSDVAMWPMTIERDNGQVIQGAVESETFFTSTYWLFPEDGGEPVKWPIPMKSDISGIYRDWVLLSLKEDWQIESQDQTFQTGDLVAFDVQTFLDTHELPQVSLIFRPDTSQAVSYVSVAKGAAILSIKENVAGKLLRIEPQTDASDSAVSWSTEEISLPGKGNSYVTFANRHEDTVFIGYEDFLTPESLLTWDRETGETKPIVSLPAKFDAEGLQIQQHFATSADGTEIPYFLVAKKGIELDGSTPTLLYAYGGFQVSMSPSYSPVTGKLWLERGGAYVLANIRGGGEFGPEWHQAGLKTKRQIIYDDFIAIAEKLIADGITSPKKLGIMGGSNGGLLMGVMLTQRPDLWNAVVVQVPLLDMLRYHLLLAGASWVDEYGSPDVPEERAFLEQISPVHNFHPGEKAYPTPFFVTSTKDDRVHPGHARKMAALFQQANLPFYYYENIDGGHSAAANQMERAKRSALEYAYLAKQLLGE